MTKKPSVGILGGGITGLSVAYSLQKKDIEAVVYEKNHKAGGVIQSVKEEGWLFEKGPNTLQIRNQEMWDLLNDLQLGSEIRKAGGSARKRFIVKDGIPQPIPLSLPGFLKTPLFSPSAKLRLMREPFVPVSERSDESVARFISRRLGREPLDYAVDPFVSGVYAGDPDKLSVKHTFSALWEMEQTYGSLLKGAFRRPRNKNRTSRALVSFEGGMETLPLALKQHLGEKVRCGTEVQKLTRIPDGWKVKVSSPEGVTELEHKVIVSTLPAHSLNKILNQELQQEESCGISGIPYAPLSVIALGFKREQVEHPLDGFGMLIPQAEGFRILGTLFSSTLFPNRTPENHVLLTSFIGGARYPELAHMSTQELMTIAVQELSHLLGIRGTPVFTKHVYWKRAIPQYETGYESYLDVMSQIETQQPGLLLAGSYRGGVSVPDCIMNGIETARRAEMFVSSSGN